MRSIQMTIGEALLSEVDRTMHRLGTTRSAFVREALLLALKQRRILLLEQKHREGYAQKPIEPRTEARLICVPTLECGNDGRGL
jgi:metal-responsive CopG/Arc/MetJ family transcriptional regulator